MHELSNVTAQKAIRLIISKTFTPIKKKCTERKEFLFLCGTSFRNIFHSDTESTDEARIAQSVH